MEAFYAEIRQVHVATVLTSGALFLARGPAGMAGAGWANGAAVRLLHYTLDTVLLTAAFMLMPIVGQYPFADPWLTVKVTLLAVFVGLRVLAFRTAATRAARVWSWAAGLAVYAFIYTVARAHDPFGAFASFG